MTRPRRSRSRTTRRTGCPARSGPRTWAARCASRGPWSRATCRSTRTPRCATGRRSAGSSSPGSAASSARTPWMPSPRPRTCSSRRRTEHMRGLADRVAVITGAGSGIGLATAMRLAAEGARIVAVDVDEAAGKSAAEKAGGLFVRADVSVEEDVRRMYATAHEACGSVDIAFNNAGISPADDDSILATDLDTWDRVQQVNLTSVYLCCKHALGYMRRQSRGSVINTASFVAVMGSATSQISYTASKGGVLALSRELGVQ